MNIIKIQAKNQQNIDTIYDVNDINRIDILSDINSKLITLSNSLPKVESLDTTDLLVKS